MSFVHRKKNRELFFYKYCKINNLINHKQDVLTGFSKLALNWKKIKVYEQKKKYIRRIK
jgi:hypothetical protein